MSKKKITDPLALPDALQKHWKIHKCEMVAKEEYRGHTYFLGEGGPHHDAEGRQRAAQGATAEPGELDYEDEWMKKGYYVSVWALQRGKAVLGIPAYFELNHNPEWTKRTKRDGRIQEARTMARETIDTMIQSGLLENKTGNIILPRNVGHG